MSKIKIALVHDFLNQMGGAEKVVWEFHQLFLDAPLFTSIYDQQKMPVYFKEIDIKTSFMQKLPWVFKLFRFYFWIYPFAFRRFALSQYDVILSGSTAFAKSIKKPKNALHIHYCNTPPRFLWMFEHYMQREKLPKVIKILVKLLTLPLRFLDFRAAQNVDYFIANTKNVADRIKKIYKRDSVIIYPPVETHKFRLADDVGDYYLIVSRLNTYKRIDLAVKAFNQLGYPLVIIGEGPDRKALEKLAKPNVKFLGRRSDEETVKYFARCRAFIFPGEEDYGITPVEAMAGGRPVVAYARGGALETVVDGKTGVYFYQQTESSLVEAVKKLSSLQLDPKQIRAHAQKFDSAAFKNKIKEFIDHIYQERIADT